jgi:type II secretion system protein J
MIQTRHPSRLKKGFTLIEILLTVAIFAIVLAAITGVFFTALRLTMKANDSFETSLPIQHALMVMKRDIEGVRFPGGIMTGSFQSLDTISDGSTANIGTKVSPFLYTAVGKNNDDDASWSEMRKVGYFLNVPANHGVSGGKDLIRAVSSNLLPVNVEEFSQEWVLGGIDNVIFSYYDGAAWIDSWDSTLTTNLPVAVKVSFTFTDDQKGNSTKTPLELLVPIISQTRTNK